MSQGVFPVKSPICKLCFVIIIFQNFSCLLFAQAHNIEDNSNYILLHQGLKSDFGQFARFTNLSLHVLNEAVFSGSITIYMNIGTDSDGDSGIDLSLKRHKLGSKNSLAPKLRKFSGTLSLRITGHNAKMPLPSPRTAADISRLTPPTEDDIDQSEESIDLTSLSQPSSSSIASQSQHTLYLSKNENSFEATKQSKVMREDQRM